MSVVDRAALEDSPLADLHAIASELSIDSYRRLRRPELIDAILERQSGEDGTSAAAEDEETEAEDASAKRRRGRRGGRSRTAAKDDEPREEEPEPELEPELESEPEAEGETETEATEEEADAPRGRSRSRGGRGRGERGRGRAAEERESEERPEEAEEPEEAAEGVVELLPNGSGFLRVSPPEPSDDDVYISAAQVKRCELVSGDRVSGPRRAPRRSERFASLIRIDTINGQPATELATGARFDDLPAAFPSERFKLGSADPTIKAIEWLTPFGQGSRVTIVGGSRSGKTEALRRLAAVLAGQEELQLTIALAGIRPEEIADWAGIAGDPAVALSFASSADAQDHAVELVIDQARRIAARGANAVVLIDTLDGLHPHAARKVLAAARNIVDGGSLTVIATAAAPVGGETTVIALDAALAGAGRFPALDLASSGTIRAELLVGDAGAEAIARARAEVLEG